MSQSINEIEQLVVDTVTISDVATQLDTSVVKALRTKTEACANAAIQAAAAWTTPAAWGHMSNQLYPALANVELHCQQTETFISQLYEAAGIYQTSEDTAQTQVEALPTDCFI